MNIQQIIILVTFVLPTCLQAMDKTGTSQKSLNEQFIKAAKSGSLNAVSELLTKGAQINTQDTDRNTALIWAAFFGHNDVVRLLIQRKVDLNIRGDQGLTALHWAAMNNHVSIFNALMAAQADPTLRNNFGATTLILAALNGCTDCVIALINTALTKEGIDLNAQDSNGFTALQWALKNKHADIANVLKEAGA